MGRRAVAVDLQAEDRPVLKKLRRRDARPRRHWRCEHGLVLKAADGMSANGKPLWR